MHMTLFIVFATSLPGVVFLSSAADMASNIFALDANASSLVTAYLNASNFIGRFAWGFFTDKVGRKSFWFFSAVVQCLALLAMRWAVQTGASALWMACFLLIGSLYGGLFGVLPAHLSDMFGAKISSATHGTAIFFWSLACVVGAPIFAAVNARYAVALRPGDVPTPSAAGYAVNALWLAAFPASAVLAVLFMNVRREDRRVAARTRTLRARCCAHVCVVGGGGGGGAWRCLGEAEQLREYSEHRAGEEEEAAAAESPAAAVAPLPLQAEQPRAQLLAGAGAATPDWAERIAAWDANK